MKKYEKSWKNVEKSQNKCFFLLLDQFSLNKSASYKVYTFYDTIKAYRFNLTDNLVMDSKRAGTVGCLWYFQNFKKI